MVITDIKIQNLLILILILILLILILLMLVQLISQLYMMSINLFDGCRYNNSVLCTRQIEDRYPDVQTNYTNTKRKLYWIVDLCKKQYRNIDININICII